MADLGDLIGGVQQEQRQRQGRITRSYSEGLRLGMDEQNRAMLQALRASQVKSRLAQEARFRALSPHIAEAWDLLTDPEVDISKDPRAKELAAEVFAADSGGDLLAKMMDDRNSVEVARTRLNKLTADEDMAQHMINAFPEEATAGLSPQDVTGIPVQALTSGLIARSTKERTASTQAAISARHGIDVDLKKEQLELDKMKALVSKMHIETLDRLTDLQSRALVRKLEQGGYENQGDFQNDWVPFFLNIMTKGKIARRGATQEERSAAEAATFAAWNRIVIDGMGAAEAINSVLADPEFKIMPTEKGWFGGKQTKTEPILERLRGRGREAEGRQRDEEIRKAISDAVIKSLKQEEEP